MEHFYQDIEGWFDFEDLYREAVKRMPETARVRTPRVGPQTAPHGPPEESEPGRAMMVEVGVYKGRSCFFLAVEALNSGKDIHIVAVDRFNWPATAQADFARIRREKGLTKVISMIEATSVQASRQFDDASVDFVFLDADHSYEAVKADIAAWWPKIKPGGILAGHDFCDEFPGVQKAVEEWFYASSLSYFNFRKIEPQSWWFDKR